MADFQSHRSYRDFAFAVSRRWRYALPTEHSEFLQTVIATSADKIESLPSGSLLFRAQVGHDWEPHDFGGGVIQDIECPLSPERMKPLSDRAFEGRANAKGIPCLYVATHERTAIAESRPWVGALVSVAQLRTARDLRVLNCTTDGQRRMIYQQEPVPEERQRAVWRDIDQAFAEPVLRTDDVADYAPTQMLAEFFRQNGLDGVGYRSALGVGHNLAIFDLDTAYVLNCSLVRVDRVSLDYSEAANPYFVSKYYPSSGRTANTANKAEEGPSD
jgi:RES domain